MNINDPAIEARALDETETAIREIAQAGLNIGLKRLQLVLMLRRVADEFEPPKLIAPSTATVQ